VGEPACSVASLAANESLAGTAIDSVDRWLLLEVTDPWAPKALQTEALPEAVRKRLAEWQETPRSRVQLIRRPGRSGKRPLVIVVSKEEARQVALERYEDLVDHDLDALPAAPSEPMVLVCVHGRRDRCCAQHGSAVYRALQARMGDIWQTSHLGGHRFAACVLSLPEGLMYGRLRPEHAGTFAASLHAGEVGDLELFRGRCEYDRPTQAAEIFLRRRIGERGVGAIQWLATDANGEMAWTVRFRSASEEHVVQVTLENTGLSSPASCGGEPEPVTRFAEL
jgi:hypothetical protein